MLYHASPVGNEISCVFHGVDSKLLEDHPRLEGILRDALAADKFNIEGELDKEFNPQGYSIIALLSESHAAIHTYPEFNSLHFDIYTCRAPGDGKKTFEYLKEKLNPSDIDYHERPVRVSPPAREAIMPAREKF